MKILLVDPPIGQIVDSMPYKEGPAFAIGLLSIDSYLEKHGYYEIELENYFGCGWEDIKARLRQSNPDIIGLSCTTDSRGFCWRLARLAKEIRPDVKIVLGNVHATFFPRQMIEHHPIDFCVLSEGEETMLELVRAIESRRTDYSDILGVAWRDPVTGEIKVNGQRPLTLTKYPLTANVVFLLTWKASDKPI